MWGRTLLRWEDAESVKGYDIAKGTLQKIFQNKLNMVNTCRESWPTYARYKEDHDLMRMEWKERYAGVRLVMWDNTNVSMQYKPGDPHLQRLTYSSYYNENCAKGGVFMQLCGWMGVHNLWTGAASDSMYLNKSEILNIQDRFASSDLVDNVHIPFTDMLDKGYRSTVAAWYAGNQLVLQPNFKKSDMKFRGVETISSAGVATDRSANERGVKYSKSSGVIARGMCAKSDFKKFDDLWLAWGFQVNFMYESCL